MNNNILDNSFKDGEDSARQFTVFGSESGMAIIWAIFFCGLVAGAYTYGGRELLEKNLAPFYQQLVLVTVGLVCFAFLGCGLHLLVLGGNSNSELRRLIRKQNNELLGVLETSNKTIAELQAQLGRCALKLGPRGLDCFGMARRIAKALNERTAEIDRLLKSGSSVDLIDADELLRKKLILSDNAMESLIGTDPVPPLAHEEWIPALTRLLAEVESERKKFA